MFYDMIVLMITVLSVKRTRTLTDVDRNDAQVDVAVDCEKGAMSSKTAVRESSRRKSCPGEEAKKFSTVW